tara:strand:- start:371 stop:496 length:126 start_codon:yes stop_codon:yes gene_type:complete
MKLQSLFNQIIEVFHDLLVIEQNYNIDNASNKKISIINVIF